MSGRRLMVPVAVLLACSCATTSAGPERLQPTGNYIEVTVPGDAGAVFERTLSGFRAEWLRIEMSDPMRGIHATSATTGTPLSDTFTNYYATIATRNDSSVVTMWATGWGRTNLFRGQGGALDPSHPDFAPLIRIAERLRASPPQE